MTQPFRHRATGMPVTASQLAFKLVTPSGLTGEPGDWLVFTPDHTILLFTAEEFDRQFAAPPAWPASLGDELRRALAQAAPVTVTTNTADTEETPMISTAPIPNVPCSEECEPGEPCCAKQPCAYGADGLCIRNCCQSHAPIFTADPPPSVSLSWEAFDLLVELVRQSRNELHSLVHYPPKEQSGTQNVALRAALVHLDDIHDKLDAVSTQVDADERDYFGVLLVGDTNPSG